MFLFKPKSNYPIELSDIQYRAVLKILRLVYSDINYPGENFVFKKAQLVRVAILNEKQTLKPLGEQLEAIYVHLVQGKKHANPIEFLYSEESSIIWHLISPKIFSSQYTDDQFQANLSFIGGNHSYLRTAIERIAIITGEATLCNVCGKPRLDLRRKDELLHVRRPIEYSNESKYLENLTCFRCTTKQ